MLQTVFVIIFIQHSNFINNDSDCSIIDNESDDDDYESDQGYITG